MPRSILEGADGVVVSSYRLFVPNGLIIGGLKQLPRLREEGDSVYLTGRLGNSP